MPTPPNASVTIVVMTREELDTVICHAARLGAEEAIRKMPKDRPEQVNYTGAGKLLGLSRQTVAKMVRAHDTRRSAPPHVA